MKMFHYPTLATSPLSLQRMTARGPSSPPHSCSSPARCTRTWVSTRALPWSLASVSSESSACTACISTDRSSAPGASLLVDLPDCICFFVVIVHICYWDMWNRTSGHGAGGQCVIMFSDWHSTPYTVPAGSQDTRHSGTEHSAGFISFVLSDALASSCLAGCFISRHRADFSLVYITITVTGQEDNEAMK